MYLSILFKNNNITTVNLKNYYYSLPNDDAMKHMTINQNYLCLSQLIVIKI